MFAGHKPAKYSHKQWIEVVVGGWSKELAPQRPPPGGCWRALQQRHPKRAGTPGFVEEVRAWLDEDAKLRHLLHWNPMTKRGLPSMDSQDWNAFLRETVVPQFNGGQRNADLQQELLSDEAVGDLLQELQSDEAVGDFLDVTEAAIGGGGGGGSGDSRKRPRAEDACEPGPGFADEDILLADVEQEGTREDNPGAVSEAEARLVRRTSGPAAEAAVSRAERSREEEDAESEDSTSTAALSVTATPHGFISKYVILLDNLRGLIEAHLAASVDLPEDEKRDLQAQADKLSGRLEAHRRGTFSHYRGEVALGNPRPDSLAARISRLLARMADQDERSAPGPAPAPAPAPKTTCAMAPAPTYRTLCL